jgi:hypothetical protein
MDRSSGLRTRKPQIVTSLRFRRDEKRLLSSNFFLEAPLYRLSSRPKRTRISYFALPSTTKCAALCKESRMQTINATGLHRKSVGAKWRDLCVDALSWKCFSRSGGTCARSTEQRSQRTRRHGTNLRR